MKNVNSFGKELFPGAIINFVVKSTKKRYRAKVNSIKNHNYDADVYDDVEEVSPGDKVDTAMTGVIITDKVLVDLHFIKVEMKHANIYFHLNLVGDTDCIISAIKDEHGKMTFYLKNMADGVIKNKPNHAARLKRLPALLETEIGVENIIEKIPKLSILLIMVFSFLQSSFSSYLNLILLLMFIYLSIIITFLTRFNLVLLTQFLVY